MAERQVAVTGLGKARGSVELSRSKAAQMIFEATPAGERPTPPKVSERLMRSVGIDSRGQIAEGESTSTMAIEAAVQAVERAGILVEDVRVINLATGLPDNLGSATAAVVQAHLNAGARIPDIEWKNSNWEIKGRRIAVRDISSGCPGFIHALQLTYASVDSQRYGLGGPQLVIASEPTSKGISPDIPNTFAIFGDGAAAAVLNLVETHESMPDAIFIFGSDGENYEQLYVPAGGSREFPSAEAIEKGRTKIDMDGKFVFENAGPSMKEGVLAVLRECGLSLDDIDRFIFHQANLQIVNELSQDLHLASDRVYNNIGRYGNTSAASIPIAMTEAWELGILRRGHILAVATYGSGPNWAAAILPMNGLPENPQNLAA